MGFSLDTGRSLTNAAVKESLRQRNLCIIFIGESNSGGIAPNADATVGEIAAKPLVQIWDNVGNASFNALDIGTNNLLGHAGLTGVVNPNAAGNYDATTHGWELGLAENIEEVAQLRKTIYLLKAGQGGSRLLEWAASQPYRNTFELRWNAMSAYFAANSIANIDFAIWHSHGINDQVAGTAAATWSQQMRDFHVYLRGLVGANVPICITQLPTNYPTYNAAMQEIVDANPSNILINTSDLTTFDGRHWGYTATKQISYRALAETLAHYYVPGAEAVALKIAPPASISLPLKSRQVVFDDQPLQNAIILQTGRSGTSDVNGSAFNGSIVGPQFNRLRSPFSRYQNATVTSTGAAATFVDNLFDPQDETAADFPIGEHVITLDLNTNAELDAHSYWIGQWLFGQYTATASPSIFVEQATSWAAQNWTPLVTVVPGDFGTTTSKLVTKKSTSLAFQPQGIRIRIVSTDNATRLYHLGFYPLFPDVRDRTVSPPRSASSPENIYATYRFTSAGGASQTDVSPTGITSPQVTIGGGSTITLVRSAVIPFTGVAVPAQGSVSIGTFSITGATQALSNVTVSWGTVPRNGAIVLSGAVTAAGGQVEVLAQNISGASVNLSAGSFRVKIENG